MELSGIGIDKMELTPCQIHSKKNIKIVSIKVLCVLTLTTKVINTSLTKQQNLLELKINGSSPLVNSNDATEYNTY